MSIINRLSIINCQLTKNYRVGGGISNLINKRSIDKINKDYEITNRNISDFS